MDKINQILHMLYNYKQVLSNRKNTQWTHQDGKFILPVDPEDLLSEIIAKVVKIEESN